MLPEKLYQGDMQPKAKLAEEPKPTLSGMEGLAWSFLLFARHFSRLHSYLNGIGAQPL
jgi:hypothetical protein